MWESTNLCLSKDWQEITPKAVSGTQPSENQKRTRSINHRGLNEHGDNGLVQPANSRYPHASANVPSVQGESDDYHEGEEDVERNQ